MNKKVFHYDEPKEAFWTYEYQFSYIDNHNQWVGYASDSLKNLKEKVKELRLSWVWISTSCGQLTYGQNFVDETFYKPRYNK
jgi:hypothetical protein